MVVDDVVINKVAAIEVCVKKIRQYSGGRPESLLEDEIRLEAVMLNLQRACENAIDLAMHLIRVKRLTIPQTSRDAFEILAGSGVISRDLLARMKALVGFRNIAIHEYQRVDPNIVVAIVVQRLTDFTDFIDAAKKAS